MFEKTPKNKAHLSEELMEAKLNKPFSPQFQVMVVIKQRKDAGIATTALDIERLCGLSNSVAAECITTFEQIGMIEQKFKEEYCITEKGERFLYGTILPIFSAQQKAIIQEILKRLDIDYFDKKHMEILQQLLAIEKKNTSDPGGG